MNSAPQVATAEISDAELDAVSGGLQSNTVDTATGLVNAVAPASGVLTDTAIDNAEGFTGLHTAPVTNLVTGL